MWGSGSRPEVRVTLEGVFDALLLLDLQFVYVQALLDMGAGVGMRGYTEKRVNKCTFPPTLTLDSERVVSIILVYDSRGATTG